MSLIDLTTKFWPKGIVPYEISEAAKSLGWETAIRTAIFHWGALTPIRFVERKPFIHPNWVLFDINFHNQAAGCSVNGQVGMQGGKQTVLCRSTGTPSTTTIIHEIGHVIGLKHEHQRMDRDDHVDVNLQLADMLGRFGDYEKLILPYYFPYGNYDCQSVMHYRTNNIITAKSGGNCSSTLGANTLSRSDIDGVEWMYPSTGTAKDPLQKQEEDDARAIPTFDPLKVPSVAVAQWWRPKMSGSRPMPRKDVFARGLDRQIYQSWREPDSWSEWTAAPGPGGTFRTGPAAISWASDRLVIFAVGDDFHLYQTSWNGQKWSGWFAPLGDGEFYWAPAVVSRAENQVDLFAVDKDFQMSRVAWNGERWSRWQQDLPAGKFLFGPSAVSWGKNRLDVFAIGLDLRLYQATWLAGTGWQGWHAHFGDRTFVSAPTAISRQSNSFDIFARSNDRAIYHIQWQNGNWSEWTQDLGEGTFTSGPAAVAIGQKRMEVYAVGDDQKMWRTIWKAEGGWSGWFADMGEGKFR